MTWIEQEPKSRKKIDVTQERAQLLDKVKKEVLPPIAREAEQGDKRVEPLHFQPVKSPGLFEAEFGKVGTDIVFHFWPWGLHEADREGRPRPPFEKRFREELRAALLDTFEAKFVTIGEDRDMGAIFVKARTYGSKQFWFDLGRKAVTLLHGRLGGEP